MKETIYAPSPLQAGMLYESKTGGGGEYIQQIVVTSPEEKWDFLEVRSCWAQIIAKQEIFRMGVVVSESGPGIIFRENIEWELETKAFPKEFLREFLEGDRKRGIDVTAGPLWRLTLVDHGNAGSLVWTFHHILLDGRSHTKVFEAFWRMMDFGEVPEIAGNSFRKYLQWLSERLPEESEGFFQEIFSGVESLPIVSSGASCTSLSSATWTCLGPGEKHALEEGAQRFGVTLHTLVQAAWGLVLTRHGDVKKAVFGSVRAGRYWGGEAHEDDIGCFIATVPFAVSSGEGQTVEEWLQQIRGLQVAYREHEYVPLGQIKKWAGFAGLLFNTVVMFDYASLQERAKLLGAPWTHRRVSLHEKTRDISLVVHAGERLDFSIDYPVEDFSRAEMGWLFTHFLSALQGIAKAKAGAAVHSISIFGVGEEPLISSWNGGRRPLPYERVHDKIDELARVKPGAMALEFGESWLTYGQLSEETDRIAGWLVRHYHLLPGDRVLVFTDREPSMVLAMLSLFKMGGVFVPLDPATPVERVTHYLKDSAAVLVITTEKLKAGFPQTTVPLVTLEALEAEAAQSAGGGQRPETKGGDAPAYLLYTSGSTGFPKGALSGHRGLVNCAQAQLDIFGLGEGDRIAQFSSPSFDGCIFDVTMALYAGATLVFGLWEELHSGVAVAKFLRQRKISAALFTPTFLQSIPEGNYPDLRVAISGGEVCSKELAEKWAEGRRFFNAYGPTETTIWSNCEEVRLPLNGHPSIGKVIPNATNYVLGTSGKILPIGVPGELYIGGECVGLGYINLPEKSGSSFLGDPFLPGGRMYRTGDRVRRLPDGRIDFVGRMDRQVKIRGIRIDLGEIEAGLMRCRGVKEAAVVYHENDFAAFVAPPVSEEDLKQELAKEFNFYLVPDRIVMLSELPKTLTGKLDRTSLRDGLKGGDLPLSRLLPEEERELVLVEWNRPPSGASENFSEEDLVVSRVFSVAKGAPDSLATSAGKEKMAYGELVFRASQVAELLRPLEEKQPIVVFVETDHRVPALLLGVLKSGRPYVPLDPTMPEERIAHVIRESGAVAVLTQAQLKGRLPVVNLPVHIADAEWEFVATLSGEGGSVSIDPEDLAYIIYTSGSTGTPKGVEIEHRSLANLCRHYQGCLGLDATDRSSLLASISFDASVADLWPYLTCGASVHVPPAGGKVDLRMLVDWMVEEGVTRCFAPTALGELLFDVSWPDGAVLKDLLVGGDRLTRHPGILPFRVINTYGPTECTVDAVWHEVPQTGALEPPPIGRPITNYTAFVVDSELRPVAVGEMGQLLLGGTGVARGYRNDPEKTRQRFVENPFGAGRLYCTGDMVRYGKDGVLEFIGRSDNQVQIYGFRVELGEIEGAFRTIAGVREAYVRVVDAAKKKFLVAYLSGDAGLDGDEAKAQAEKFLPPYMVPHQIFVLEKLPRNAAGKVDKERLPAFSQKRGKGAGTEKLSATEEAILAVAREVLGRADLGVADNFFDVGGDSIFLLSLLLQIEKRFGKAVAAMSFLQNPCVRHLAALVDDRDATRDSCILPIKTDGGKPPFFCVCPASWFRPIAQQIDKERPLHALEILMLGDDFIREPKIETIGAGLVEAVLKICPEGPHLLGGYSSNGMAVVEMARILVERGEKLPPVILFDVPVPSLLRTGKAARIFWRFWHLLTDPRRVFPALANLFSRRETEGVAGGEVAEEVRKYQAFARRLHMASANYSPSKIDVDFVVIRPSEMPHDLPYLRDLGWRKYCRSLTVYELPGDHRSFLKNDEELARILEKHLG